MVHFPVEVLPAVHPQSRFQADSVALTPAFPAQETPHLVSAETAQAVPSPLPSAVVPLSAAAVSAPQTQRHPQATRWD